MRQGLAAACAAAIGFALWVSSAGAAVLTDDDSARLAAITAAIEAFENDVGAALHNLAPQAAGEIESYAYVELNLEAAHERLNNVFMLVALSVYVDAPADERLVLDVLSRQILPPSRNYVSEKHDAIASMAAARPSIPAFADYRSRADDLLGRRALAFLDELAARIAAARP